MIPNRWLSESRHVGFRFVHCRQRGEKLSLGLGLRGCVAGCTTNRPRTGLRWARSTEADGEGDVREARDTKSAPAALDKGPLIDGCLDVSRTEGGIRTPETGFPV